MSTRICLQPRCAKPRHANLRCKRHQQCAVPGCTRPPLAKAAAKDRCLQCTKRDVPVKAVADCTREPRIKVVPPGHEACPRGIYCIVAEPRTDEQLLGIAVFNPWRAIEYAAAQGVGPEMRGKLSELHDRWIARAQDVRDNGVPLEPAPLP